MAERNERALAAARDVFLRYGVRRATMGDIATEAGISRQTLYTLFGGKDAVLRAVIADHTTTSIAAIRSDAAAAPDLAAALDALFMHFTQTPFTLLHASPNAEDILQGRDRIAREAHEAARPAYEAAIADVLAPHASALMASRPSGWRSRSTPPPRASRRWRRIRRRWRR